MRTGVRVLLVLSLALLFSMSASATTLTSQVVLLPDGSVAPSGELDTVWPDSLYYYTPSQYSSLMPSSNYWSGTRFTAPNNFQLQGIRFLALNQAPNTEDPCEVYVYTNDNGQPDQALLGPLHNAVLPAWPNWVEIVIDEEDYLDIAAGEDFWIIYGPAPGGPYPNPLPPGYGWWNIFDAAASPGERSKMSTSGIEGNYSSLSGDLFITAEGSVESFFDLYAKFLYNDIEKFFFTTEDEAGYIVRINNLGNTESPAGTVEFEVVDEDGNSMFTETVDIPAIAAGDSVELSTENSWQPLFTGRYLASAVIDAEGDPDESNDTALLLQSIVEGMAWYVYDDGTFETGSNFNEGSGWAVAFKPITYPAFIDSGMWYFGSANADVNLQAWSMVGTTIEQLWTNENGSVGADWNEFAINDAENPDGFNLQDGDFVLMYVFSEDDAAFPIDENLPISAANDPMPDAAYQVGDGGGTWYFDSSGNWGMRAHMGQGVAPDIEFSTSELDFGDVVVETVAYQSVTVTNSGDGDAVIDSVRIGQSQITLETTLPLVIEPEGQADLTFAFYDEDEGSFQGGALIYHNDINASANPFLVRLFANVIGDVREESNEVPNEYFVEQNYPNPFNPTTEIRFGLKEPGMATLTVYNVMGQEVARLVSEDLNAGIHVATFDASGMASGIYFYRLTANNFTDMRKMMLMR